MKAHLFLRLLRAFAFVTVGLSIVSGAGAAVIPTITASGAWSNPFESSSNPNCASTIAGGGNCDQLQTQTIVTFTAATTGTLQGYFVGGITTNGNPVGFQNAVGVVLGAPPRDANGVPTGSAVNTTYFAPNDSANFGASLFSGVTVTAGQTITFVLSANQASTPSTCCGAPIDQTRHYNWSDESSTLSNTAPALSFAQNGAALDGTYAGVKETVGTANSGYNAMAYVANVNATGTITANTSCTTGSGNSRDCVPSERAGTSISAGNYTFVGFNDWLGGPSNSYFDYALLFNIKPTSVPEPGTLVLVLLALLTIGQMRRQRGAAVFRARSL